MSTATAIIDRENTQKIGILMGLPQDDYDYDALVEGTFLNDESRNNKFRNRINFKDSQITMSYSATYQTNLEELYNSSQQKTMNNTLLLGKDIPYYTNEYIILKRKEHILMLLTYIEEFSTTLDDLPLSSMYLKLFFNEISIIYKNFIKVRQEENFLSIINLLEEVFKNNQINKKLIKAYFFILKSIKDIDNISYNYYENAVKKCFELDIDFIGIKEI